MAQSQFDIESMARAIDIPRLKIKNVLGIEPVGTYTASSLEEAKEVFYEKKDGEDLERLAEKEIDRLLKEALENATTALEIERLYEDNENETDSFKISAIEKMIALAANREEAYVAFELAQGDNLAIQHAAMKKSLELTATLKDFKKVIDELEIGSENYELAAKKIDALILEELKNTDSIEQMNDLYLQALDDSTAEKAIIEKIATLFGYKQPANAANN